ncbi:N-acetylglucosamine kinase [Nonomuraea sp. NPDC050328]|uniref:N-acetylglucosamine kinase n=1 Tax=Nonomuraea sp. NPDC050328 TaxID=3364361 RepID=UPI003790E390
MTKPFVVGVDAGATSTRVAVHALDGTRLGYGTAGPGNPSAHGVDKAAGAVREALTIALGDLDPDAVRGSVAGVAGQSPAFAQALADLWHATGLPIAPTMVKDVPIAYAAGTGSPDGSLLLSGTGAVAARFAGHEVEAIADGLGWLLGDAGSGFWIGRAGAKAAVEALDRDEPEGELVALVCAHFLGEESWPTARLRADRIVRLAQADHMRLAAVSRLVGKAAENGDRAATAIVEEAARELVATVGRVHRGGPIVLAGSVLTNEGPVRRAVLERLGELAERVETARDGAGAAAWTAARLLDPTAPHAPFTRG